MNNLEQEKDWYHGWFDSPFYHILYQNRDDQEARKFLKKLIDILSNNYGVTENAKVLDVACGRGRHALYLNELGYAVTGIDLSQSSILSAKKHENSRLSFECHDMREVYRPVSFDLVLNLFTSFGYFESENDDFKVIQSLAHNLKPNGILVLDYFNPNYVRANISSSEIKTIEGIDFNLSRRIDEDFVVKDIEFLVDGHNYHFQEKVRLIEYSLFLQYFSRVGLNVKTVFGDYNLLKFDPISSERMIYVCKAGASQ